MKVMLQLVLDGVPVLASVTIDGVLVITGDAGDAPFTVNGQLLTDVFTVPPSTCLDAQMAVVTAFAQTGGNASAALTADSASACGGDAVLYVSRVNIE